MMRFNFAINAVLGALLVTPALTLGVQHNDSLENALKRTVASLEELSRIERRFQEKDPSAIADILSASESALQTNSEDPSARDAALQDLRGVVSGLQRSMDELETNATPQAIAQAARIPVVEPALENPLPSREALTVGLDDSLRRRLGERASRRVSEAGRGVGPTVDTAAKSSQTKTAFETESYTADALRLGRAQYRQGEYENALTTLKESTGSEGLYWKARCLEKLSRDADAIAAYKQVMALPDAGYSGQRAKEDLEFLEWRLAFERTRPKGEANNEKKAAGASAPKSEATKP